MESDELNNMICDIATEFVGELNLEMKVKLAELADSQEWPETHDSVYRDGTDIHEIIDGAAFFGAVIIIRRALKSPEEVDA